MMENLYTEALVEMGISLGQLAAKGTASAVSKKIRAIKNVKDVEKLRTTYDEIINEVLQEREEAVRIAQTYKAELDRIVISDQDIEHLHNTVERIIEIVKESKLSDAVDKTEEEKTKILAQADSYEQLKELISVDTLKTMQLLGFNYKAAIGDPLTAICANAINSWGSKSRNKGNTYTNKKR